MVEHILGDPSAPVTVVEYGDYECPYCAAAEPVLRRLVDESSGQVRLVFRNFPLFETHAFALTAALAAESTVESGHFWEMHRLLFERQDDLTDEALRSYAAEVGADPATAAGEAAQAFAAKVQEDYAAGVAAGVKGTPTLFLNDEPYQGRTDYDALRKAVSRLP